MKKMILPVLSLLIALSLPLAGCGKKGDLDPPSNTGATLQ